MKGADIVPALRGDLRVSPEDGSDGKRFEVEDPSREMVFTLRDEELSIARMLNGQRTAQQVVDAARAIGLPITLVSLGHFVERLKGYGLLASPKPAAFAEPRSTPPPDGEPTTWERRDKWVTEVRQTYRAALKAMRADQLDDAEEQAKKVLELQPDNAQAKALLEALKKRRRAAAGPVPKKFSDEWADVEASWFTAGETGYARREAELPARTFVSPTVSKRRKGLVAFALALAVASAGAIPIPRELHGPVRLEALAELQKEVRAPHAGTLSAVLVKDGQWVEPGEVLARFDVEAARRKLQQAQERARALAADLQKARQDAAAAKRASDAVERLQRELDRAIAVRDRLKAEKKRSASKLSWAEKKVAQAKAALAKAKASAPDEGSSRARVDLLGEQRKAVVDQQRALEAVIKAQAVKAPAAGVVERWSAKAGQEVDERALLARLVDIRTLEAVAELDVSDRALVTAGQPMAVRVGGIEARSQVGRVTEEKGRLRVRARVDNAGRTLAPGQSGTAVVTGARQSLFARVWASLGR